ncbi:uncharacterized protein LOC129778495 [Toxorhynchites rutilus septentrionalis]|uniref:uncharacterized protein LOC129778495 n=1 Tax=Toxorhynchites rutilus septentrionalis TaxID=329112 RepID=UPI002479FF6B|nr:uncharacterized protein LOC129778495 [Toxorhynchites rutilus septentrionalis]
MQRRHRINFTEVLCRFLQLRTDQPFYIRKNRPLDILAACRILEPIKKVIEGVHEHGDNNLRDAADEYLFDQHPVKTVVRMMGSGELVSNDESLFALAYMARVFSAGDEKHMVYEQIPTLIATSRDLFIFVIFYRALYRTDTEDDSLVKGKGFGDGMKKALWKWYDKYSAKELAELLAVDSSWQKWRHKDILRMVHINLKDASKRAVIDEYIGKGRKYQKRRKIVAPPVLPVQEEESINNQIENRDLAEGIPEPQAIFVPVDEPINNQLENRDRAEGFPESRPDSRANLDQKEEAINNQLANINMGESIPEPRPDPRVNIGSEEEAISNRLANLDVGKNDPEPQADSTKSGEGMAGSSSNENNTSEEKNVPLSDSEHSGEESVGCYLEDSTSESTESTEKYIPKAKPSGSKEGRHMTKNDKRQLKIRKKKRLEKKQKNQKKRGKAKKQAKTKHQGKQNAKLSAQKPRITEAMS